MFRVLSKCTPNTIDKSLGVSKVFLEERFDIRSRDRNDDFVMALILSLSQANSAKKV